MAAGNPPAPPGGGGTDWRNVLGKFGTVLQTLGSVAAPAYAAGRSGNPAVAQAMWQQQQEAQRQAQNYQRQELMRSEFERIAPNGPDPYDQDQMRQIADVMMQYGTPAEARQWLGTLAQLANQQRAAGLKEKQFETGQDRWEAEQELREKKYGLEVRKTQAAELAAQLEDAGQGKADIKDVLSIRKSFRLDSKDFTTIADKYEQAKGAIEQVRTGAVGSKQAFQTLNVTLQKALDPISVVRESEFARTEQFQSLYGRYRNLVSRAATGEITEALAEEIFASIEMLYNAAQRYQRGRVEDIHYMSKHFKFDPELILGGVPDPLPEGEAVKTAIPTPIEAKQQLPLGAIFRGVDPQTGREIYEVNGQELVWE
jgi:hypothetical protein